MQLRGNLRLLLVAGLCLLIGGLARAADNSKEPAKEPPPEAAKDAAKDAPAEPAKAQKIFELSVKPEALSVTPGKPLSFRALVTHPTASSDAISWTIEARKHRGRVLASSLSPDCKQMAAAGTDGVVRIWDLASGELVRAMVGHNHWIHGVSWSPDGKVIATAGSWDGTIRLWNAENGMPLRVFKIEKGYCYHVAWSPDGSKLLGAGGTSGWVWLWDARTDETRILVEAGQRVMSICWSPDNEHYAITAIQNPVSIYELSSTKAVESFGDPSVINYSVRWSPDGTRLAVSGARETTVYEMPGAKELKKLGQGGYGLAWSPDSTLLCSSRASGVGGLAVFNATTGKPVRNMPAAGEELHWPQSDKLVACEFTRVAIFNPQDASPGPAYNLGGTSPPLWVPNRPIVTGLGENKLELWDGITARALRTLENQQGTLKFASWTRDGKILATSGSDKAVILWEAGTGKRAHEITDYKSSVLCLAWSPDGKTLATGCSDNLVRLVSIAGKPIGTLEGHKGPVNQLTWSPRGNLLATGGGESIVRLWNVDKQQQLHEMPSVLPVEALAFSPDGSILAAGTTDDAIQSWTTATGIALNRNMRVPGRPREVTSLGWSPDGSLLLAGRANHTTQLWSWLEPKVVHNFQANAAARYVTFAGNGSMMVTATEDRTTRFWDTATTDLRGSIVDLGGQMLLVTAEGHYKIDTARDPEFIYVVQTATEQVMLKPADFTSKYKWKNQMASVKFNR